MPRRGNRFGYFDPETNSFVPDDQIPEEKLRELLLSQGIQPHVWIKTEKDMRNLQGALPVFSIVDQRDGKRFRPASVYYGGSDEEKNREWNAYQVYLQNLLMGKLSQKEILRRMIINQQMKNRALEAAINRYHLPLAEEHIRLYTEEQKEKLEKEQKRIAAQEKKLRKKEEEAAKDAERLRRQLEKKTKQAEERKVRAERGRGDPKIKTRKLKSPY